MERGRIFKTLQQNREEITSYGVKNIALSGSMARGDDHPGSDVYLLVEFNRPAGLFGLISLQLRLDNMLECPVDIGTMDSLKASTRQNVLEECI